MIGGRVLLPGLLAALLALPAGATDPDREIDYLLRFVAASGCTFHRNGADHDSAEAADHLRLKLRRGGRYADTAEHFIDRLASSSSWTGEVYTVTCEDRTEPSGDWLHRALEAYRGNPASASTAVDATAEDTSAGGT